MGTRPRPRPMRLAKKLRTIRKKLRLSQSELAARLGFDKGGPRISEYETGAREPSLSVLLGYARVARVCTCVLIDDDVKVAEIRRRHFPQ